ncbi:hypothetical protein QKU48_gp1339 [Fadolivirus algeromassiliense]|jgi:hypothetical protein|uniref:Uncharacterized protein n=1 Tax=Fadolivirus FV1/VV64 TaxID=3070911 RepID=A0A7D3V986_9VIRU|nr:hypothetical protein QKU48_gp1339 [Fadolivirus algeromassiliense]QKF94797.1 hypothetical protein Fadolivirus_1_1339 [Fadolivirus FV1/VV64]
MSDEYVSLFCEFEAIHHLYEDGWNAILMSPTPTNQNKFVWESILDTFKAIAPIRSCIHIYERGWYIIYGFYDKNHKNLKINNIVQFVDYIRGLGFNEEELFDKTINYATNPKFRTDLYQAMRFTNLNDLMKKYDTFKIGSLLESPTIYDQKTSCWKCLKDRITILCNKNSTHDAYNFLRNLCSTKESHLNSTYLFLRALFSLTNTKPCDELQKYYENLENQYFENLKKVYLLDDHKEKESKTDHNDTIEKINIII